MEIGKKTKNGAYWTDIEITCPRCNKLYVGQQFLVREKESQKEIMICISCGDEITHEVVEKNKQLRIKEQVEYEVERKQDYLKSYRMSQTGKEAIVNASKIIIVDATTYLATLGIEHNRYKGLYVAVTVESGEIFSAKVAVQSRIGSWLFENVKNAIRAIRRLNKSVDIIKMAGDEYKSYLEADRAKGNDLLSKLKINRSNEKKSMLNSSMDDQWQRQQESLIALTKCLLLIRSITAPCNSSGDTEIDLKRAENNRKKIHELADMAHNLPTLISNSMMHFVTLENGNPTPENLEKFNRHFQQELALLRTQLKD